MYLKRVLTCTANKYYLYLAENIARMKKEVCLSPYLNISLIEAGCDEAGRGCLAGPVFAAAVILPKIFFIRF